MFGFFYFFESEPGHYEQRKMSETHKLHLQWDDKLPFFAGNVTFILEIFLKLRLKYGWRPNMKGDWLNIYHHDLVSNMKTILSSPSRG